MKAVIYARYSSNSQTEQSIEGQLRVCNDYCKKNNLTVVGTYIDRAISGRTDQRPEFQQMIRDSSTNMFDAVVVYKTDRFARNKYDSAIYKRQLKKNGIKIFYAAEAIPDGPEGIILEALMEGLAEYYSAELSQKIKRGMRESALKCHTTGPGVPLGYVIASDKTFQIDPDNAKIVQTIFSRYLAGDSKTGIAKYLNSLGFRTARGREFNMNSIDRILRNEKYVGTYKYGDIIIPDGIPQIISKGVFDLVQEELKKNRKTNLSTRANYMLSGKLFCGHCKEAMIGVCGTGKSGKRWYYYSCPTARRKKKCPKKNISKEWIEEFVVEQTVAYILQPHIIKDLAQKFCEMQQSDKSYKQEIDRLNKQLLSNKIATDNILTTVELGKATATLLERLESLEQERLSIQDEIQDKENHRIGLKEEELEFSLKLFLRKDGESTADYQQKIIDSFISRVEIWDDKLMIYYNISNEELSKKSFDFSNVAEFEQQRNCSTSREPRRAIRVWGSSFYITRCSRL